MAESPDPCLSPITNPVACENTLPGNPASEWDIAGAGSPTIQGFATEMSVNHGETVRFKIDTPAVGYQLDIYRLGYYGGAGARKVATVAPSATLPQPQPACAADNSTGLFDCGNWAESASWAVPANAVSGIYFAKLVRTDGVVGSSHVVFVVRDDTGHSDLLFQTSDTTWQAYNDYGGNSLQTGQPVGRAFKVSYNRPFSTRETHPADWLFNAEYPMVRWLESNGYDVSYAAGIDTDRRGGELLEHKAFLSVGHDEYWSAAQRANVEAARGAGVHLAFFSGNEMFWKARYEPSIDGSATAYRTLVSYKETLANAKIDPLADVWTGTWRDPRFSPPGDGGRPENALTGTLFSVGQSTSAFSAIQVSEAMGKLRLWRNTTLATLAPGTSVSLPAGTLGYLWDEAPAASGPAGLMRLSTTTLTVPGKLQDYGSTYAAGSATHSLTLYRHPTSHALVFGAGTVQWSWGLDAVHDRGASVADLRMQQATVNLLADMQVQPFTLTPGLTAAAASSDATLPTAVMTTPAAGSTVLLGTGILIAGTATDAVGSVAGVEVSVDGGTNWSAAAGTTAWTFQWTPSTLGSATLMARAVDDSGNIGAAVSRSVTVATSLPPSCPCSLWNDQTVPPIPDAGADGPVQLGVKFRADSDGYITKLRFYKSAANTGVHVGSLWRTDGTRLATVTFANETASGWQTQALPTPIAVTANTLYIASYHVTAGHYSFAPNYFGTSGRDAGLLHAPATTVSPNGVFGYGTSATFPNQSYNAGNYWVDVVFSTSTADVDPPTISTVSPLPGSTGVDINTTLTATFSEAMDAATISSSTVELRDASSVLLSAVVSFDGVTRTATLDPSASLVPGAVYTATVRGGTDPAAKDAAGNALAASFTWSFTVLGDTTPPTAGSPLPAAGSASIAATTAVQVTLNEAMDATTINGSTFVLRTASNALVPATVGYNAASKVATLTPISPLAALSTYTATLKGGVTDPRAKDLAGNALASDFTWSFTTAPVAATCPCSLWPTATTPVTIDVNDTNSVVLGVKFTSTSDGYITGLKFYKSAANTGTHVGSLWTSGGALLGTLTFANESASGWQQGLFTTPVAVAANATYVASYHAPNGHYSVTGGYFATAVDSSPLRAPATSTTANGLYRYGASSAFPDQTYNGNNYWVDVVFATSAAADTTAPVVSSISPSNGASGIGVSQSVSIVFSEALDPATVTASTIELRNSANVLVPASVTWNAALRTATLQASSPLSYATIYSVLVHGGSTGARVKDLAGNALAADYASSFSTGASGSTSPSQGPGGPILVVTAAANPFSTYYAEILRAEGLNNFAVLPLTSVTAETLLAYDVVILGEMPLTAAQAGMFSTWVTGGGNLLAMRPDKQMASLFGLSDTGGTLANRYVLVDPAGAGAGIVGETMQFHGTADLYALAGASPVAMLYSTATVPTSNPAVTQRTIPGGGTAVAFTYDLARSIVYTRQGNPAWAGKDRDSLLPIRSDDLFFGNATADPQTDWIDFAKVRIPQADEQQRLLANLILKVNLSRKPLPRFWYLPRGLKAAIVMTGDDHNNGGTIGRFDANKAASTPGCSVENWECIRSTSYVFTSAPVHPSTVAGATSYVNQGFEIAQHINTDCSDYDIYSFANTMGSQLGTFATAFPGIPAPTTNRTHCIVWSDFDSQPQVDAYYGVRLDTTYYYWPGTWVNDRPGLFTGSGLPMRFAKADGTLIDVYQAATQMNDEAGQTFPFTVDALLDKALGAEGFYGTFVANMHTDTPAHASSDAIIASAKARGVPVITAKQLLTWLDARNNSSFGGITWTAVPDAPLGGRALTFTVSAAAGSVGLQGMVPRRLAGDIGRLTSLLRDGVAVAFETTTVKGIEYATFAAAAGSYTANYDTTPPDTTLSATPPSVTNLDTVSFSFSSSEAGATFTCRVDGGAYAACASPWSVTTAGAGSHSVNVRSTDLAGNTDLTPATYTWLNEVTPPTIAARTPAANAVGVPLSSGVSVQFSEAMTGSTINATTFRLRRVGAATDLAAAIAISGTTATLQPAAALTLGASYEVTVAATVADAAGNPLGAAAVWTFAAANTLTDASVADFGAGTIDANGRVTQTTDGELMLVPADGSEFNGTTLPAGWSATPWNAGGTGTVATGTLTVDGARVHPSAIYGPGRVLEFSATFGTDNYQHVGFGVTMNETPWAIFSTGGGGGLYARSNNGTSETNTLVPGSWLGAPHRFRIEWTTTTLVFFIDGTQVASHTRTIAENMRPIISDYGTSGSTTRVDWMRMSAYTGSSTFTSRVLDATTAAIWSGATWNADLPAGTSVVVSVRAGNSPTPDGTWSAFTTVSAPGGALNLAGRYAQYRVQLATSDSAQSPAVRDVTLMVIAQ